ncbi:hypothetical protein BJY16_007536 [Actinoplanes octamycinicus]|uniref:LysM domain-containing protein n=1 Tax=Actinoplanes octamycinicus TaxID=135948 RepID=A0A7W7MBJ0_9ACTN|nr:LysM peptidoglycan-binding domain-containing protein [Actinoplanes octamycinicus]MBB4744077.1 hypothetical protein [Actinoplanes octamycinicus]GIE56966.1 peptidoglycan-binding protein [Actinoplanes octamycinicus]
MPLEKIHITPAGGAAITALFNPTQYTLDRGNQIAEIPIPGQAAPILQFVRGTTAVLTMELFFDTYEKQTDVREHTDRVYDLLRIDPGTHAPPICRVGWGTFLFTAVLDRVSGRFTLFLADGTPVRAILGVTFKEYVDLAVEVRRRPTESADHAKTRVVARGDTLATIAAAEYGDPARWRPIAEANGIDNPRRLEPGRVLAVPPLPPEAGS